MQSRKTFHVAKPHPPTRSSLIADEARATVLRDASRDWLSWDLTAGQLDDLELLLNGFYGRLSGFMTRAEYEAVTQDMRLEGSLWPLPVLLAVSAVTATQLTPGAVLALRSPEGVMLAVLHTADVWQAEESPLCPEQDSGERQSWCVGGRIEGLIAPAHYSFAGLRRTAAEVRAEVARRGWTQVIGFTPRTILHRAEVEGALHLLHASGAGLVVHIPDGARGDVHHYWRMRCYLLALARLPEGRVLVLMTPPVDNPRNARARLALAIVQQQVGCTHIATASQMLGLDEPADLIPQHAKELGLTLVPFPALAYDSNTDAYVNASNIQALQPSLSDAALQRLLAEGAEIPPSFTYPEIAAQLRRRYPPRSERGLTLFFTGLSGSGKSTIANVVLHALLEREDRAVTLLDGDVVRRHLSSELRFSKEHRTLNVRRVGYVASEITKSGGIAICALIAPYSQAREDVRRMVETVGSFVLVHVATRLEVCEARDRKGLYAKARAGLLPEFTGISDTYEVPTDAELTIDAGRQSVEAASGAVLRYLRAGGYLSA